MPKTNERAVQSPCYLVTKKTTGEVVREDDSADTISIFLWGKDLKDYTVYKACRFSAKTGDITEIRNILEAR